MQITINNGRLAQISETLTPTSGMKLPTDISIRYGETDEDPNYNFLTGEINISYPAYADYIITASALTQKDYFDAVANGLVDTINEKAQTSGQKGLDEAWVTAQGINAIPKIILTLSQIISQDPLAVQLTQEQYNIVSAVENYKAFEIDATALGMSVATVTKTGDAYTYCFVPNISDGVVTAWEFTLDDTNMTLTRTVHEGGGSLLDYTVTFSADGNDYYIASCLDGDGITAPTSPNKAGYAFMGWFTGEGGSGTKVTFPYTPSADTTFYAYYVAAVKATVTGVGSSSPSAVTFDVDDGFTVAGIGIEEVTMGGDTFIKIPTMYRKVNTVVDNQITSFTISTAAIDNTYQPYSVFVDENGNLLDYVLIGKYWNSSSSNMISQSQSGAVSMTISNARTFAQARGTGYQQYDWQFQKLWQDLIVVFKRSYNTNAGTAWTYDEMGIYWGTNGCWIDGICHNSAVIAVSDKPSKYVDSATASSDGYFGVSYNLPTTGSGNITKLGYDSAHPFVNYPSAASGSSYTSYYCDTYYYSSGSHPVYSRVGHASAGYGAFFCDATDVWSYTLSVRLCYRPLSA